MSSRTIIRAAARAASRKVAHTVPQRAFASFTAAIARPSTKLSTAAVNQARGIKTINFGGTEEVVHGR